MNRLVLAELEAGTAPAAIVEDLLAPAQREVGLRWQRNEINVADEHAATAAVDHALATLAATAGETPATRGSVAVVCAEGDWHSLAARMAAQILAWQGWDTTFLGGSIPASQLAGWLSAVRPDALVVTCSVPLYLPGVASIGGVASSAGVPCVGGGQALGPDTRRGHALGVHTVPRLGELGIVLGQRQPEPDPRDWAARRGLAQALALAAEETVARAMGLLADTFPGMAGYDDRQVRQTRQDLRDILSFTAAALLCDDPRLLVDFFGWLDEVLTSRGVPRSAVEFGVAALLGAMPDFLEDARALLAGATAAQGSSIPSEDDGTGRFCPDG